MTQLEQLAAVVTEQMSTQLPPARSAAEQQILSMIKKASYAAFVIGYKTARDSIAKDLKDSGLLSEENLVLLMNLGEESVNVSSVPEPKVQSEETQKDENEAK